MIRSIKIEQFFSFGEKIELILNKDVNVLIGINGSGKSNFLKAIRLLYEGVVGKDGFEEIFQKEWSGFESVCNYSRNKMHEIKLTYEFDKNRLFDSVNKKGYRFRTNPVYEITIHKLGSGGYYLSELIYNKPSPASNKKPFTYLEMKNGKGVISTRDGDKIGLQYFPTNTKDIEFKSEELILRQVSDPGRYYPLFTLKAAIEQIIVYSYFDTTLNSPIRQLSTYSVERKLLQNGENLVQILQRVKNHHSLAYEKIEDLLKSINPNFKDISFDFIGSKSLLVLRETSLSRSVPVEHISDGTLRFLLLLSIFYNPERGSLICIDEPEIGLHPDMINTVSKAIEYAANNGTQIIIATHSPILLNQFELEDIWVFEKNEVNETVVSSKDEDDFADWNEQYLAGQMWMSGKIGGTRWQ